MTLAAAGQAEKLMVPRGSSGCDGVSESRRSGGQQAEALRRSSLTYAPHHGVLADGRAVRGQTPQQLRILKARRVPCSPGWGGQFLGGQLPMELDNGGGGTAGVI